MQSLTPPFDDQSYLNLIEIAPHTYGSKALHSEISSSQVKFFDIFCGKSLCNNASKHRSVELEKRALLKRRGREMNEST